jgi:hypothetical protein
MAQHKTYFALTNFDYPPDSLIRLGQIITSPSTPWKSLADPLPIPKSAIQASIKTDWGTEVYREHDQRMGIWAQFAAMICGVGGDAVVGWSRKNEEMFQFKELATTFFEPDPEYVEASVVGEERQQVAEWVRQNPRKSLYMIAGVKVARGAQHLQARVRGVDFEVKPGVDATPFTGVPVGGGVLAGMGREKGERTWFSGSSDFVYAYRLRRIIVKRQAVSKTREYVRGATVAHEDDDNASGEHLEMPTLQGQDASSMEAVEIQSIEQSGRDYGSGGYELEDFLPFKVIDEQDEEACLLQVPEDVAQAL